MERQGMVRQEWSVTVRYGKARRSAVRQGTEWKGAIRHGKKRKKGLIKSMIYQWKIPDLIPVDAQTAGDELNRINGKYGGIDAQNVVDETRPECASLHNCFEWDDTIAAEKYRNQQAQSVIRNITIALSEPDATFQHPQPVRAFVHVRGTYQPISVVVRDEDKMAELLQSAIRELKAFEVKYRSLSQLTQIFAEIEKLTA